MLLNYLLTAMRGWVKHKLFTFINIGGLAVGLTCVVFIMLFVRDELSYDRWIPGSENLYRVEVTYHNLGQAPFPISGVPFAMPKAMADKIPEVKAMTRRIPEDMTISVDDRPFAERVSVVDPQFFDVIQLPLVQGDPSSVFAHPDSVVISQSVARKYFGSDSGVVGRTVSIIKSAGDCPPQAADCAPQTHSLAVTGVMRDLPHNTQLAIDIVIPNTSSVDRLSIAQKENWGGVNGNGYVVLAPGADPVSVLAKLRDVIESSAQSSPRPPGDKRPISEWIIPRLTPFWDAHLTTDRYGSDKPAGDRTTVYAFAIIGILILLVACFNFTNLSIARATLRSREISLRKTMGARRSQIIVQFLGEAVLMALAALVPTLALIQPLLLPFDRLLDKPITFNYLSEWPLLLAVLAMALAAGLLSGLYPALILSSVKPATALRNSSAQLTSSDRFRATLVVLQFAVSIGLGIAVAVVFAQISYARQVDLGFRLDGIVVIDRVEVMSPSNRESFINELRNYPEIVNAALGGRNIPIRDGWIGNNTSAHAQGAPSDVTLRTMQISPQFASTYDVKLLAGRLLSEDRSGDAWSPTREGTSSNVMINASATSRLGYSSPMDAIGKVIAMPGFRTTATVIGVINDIKMGGPQHLVSAAIYFYDQQYQSTVSVRVRPEHLSETLAFIDKTWSTFAPSFPVRRYFLEDEFNKQFRSDEHLGTVFMLFVGIAIFIACLGLFGLAAFTAERRTKEIGLRKTLGGKTRDIVFLLLWQFSIPVLIANVVAWPFAYYFLRGWLEGYVNHISLSPLYFIGGGAVALLIAWATVYAHAYQMARANPIKALRYE